MKIEIPPSEIVYGPFKNTNGKQGDGASFASAMDATQKAPAPSIKDEGEPDPNAWIVQKKKEKHDALLASFSNYANMTPEEMIRAKYLEKHHLTEKDVARLPEEERAALEADIKEEIKREMEADKKRKLDDAMSGFSLGDQAGGTGSDAPSLTQSRK